MSRTTVTTLVIALLGGMLLGSPKRAVAIPPFKKEFDAMYKNEADDASDAEKALAEAIDRVKCNVCHVGKDKKMRNAYGEALSELLDKKADAKDVEKIQDSLKKVAEMKSNPDDDSSPTFGSLIQEGKLPGGEEDAQ